MKKYVIPFLFLAIVSATSFTASAGTSDSAALAAKQNESMQIYHKALKYNDMSSAAYALVNYLNAGGNAVYQDSLAIVYYNMNNFSGAYKLANELYTADNKNIAALTLLADISGRGGETKTSLDWYEKLCPLSPSAYNFYQLASKQFVLERKLECMQSLQKVVSDSAEALKQSVSLEVNNGYYEQVPVLAAAYNMLGVLTYKDNNKTGAKDYYEKALKVAPNFVIAKQNVDALKPEAPKVGGKSQPNPKSKG